MKFFYINLTKRPERRDLFEKNWSKFGNTVRVDAIDMSSNKEGTMGCYLSHKKAFTDIYQSHKIAPEINIICEDDAVPCNDFPDRMKKTLSDIPLDWDILMLGCSITKNSQWSEINPLLCKAKKFVLAGHCYVVNPSFHDKMLDLHNRGFASFDIMLMYLQEHHNVYFANPSMAYQYDSFSDNSNRIVGNTHFTETFFKDKL